MGFLDEPRLKNISVGSSEFFKIQNQLISEKPLLQYCYDIWYKKLKEGAKAKTEATGHLLELGSGGSQLKRYIPNLITSDVVPGVADRMVDGRTLPFEDETILALFLTHSFHHIPDVKKFLHEANRCLIQGGTINLIEVANTPFSKFFFRNFHPEPFLTQVKSWSFDQKDSMLDSNQALSWIVFVRDLEHFKSEFQKLKIEVVEYLPWLSYLLSGGVTKRNIIPSILVQPILWLENILWPIRSLFSLHWYIRIQKI